LKELIIIYSKEADKFLSKNKTSIKKEYVGELIVKSIKLIFSNKLVNIDLKALKGDFENSPC